MNGLKILPDGQLLKAYNQAIQFQLEKAFIDILLKELKNRGMIKT